ncbi:T-cell surface antigen CD2-like isoform X2 [Xiphias gladius]|uniref:T-cell surface antigen CD2-like isoform X2 n=1 Tax=Xiphias gladius TaxID=8245 RepID=UPI001A99B027|nr:T-cell surface antigen CD2-like isoform X2 [Xiphias gladius]
MEALVGLFLMLLGVSHGMETYCDGRQNGTQCYGALGGTVVLRLMDSAPEIFRYWRNQNVILNWSDNKFKSNLISNRSFFTPSNGTLRINNLSRNDGSEYTLDIYDSGGKLLDRRTLQLSIQAPVSSVLLVSECLSQGEMKVSCSSEGGDSPQYSWTLDGRTLTDAELLSGNHETNNITLKQDVSGRLVCSVRNSVSSVSEVESISSCGFIFINCTLSNGTHISQWVLAASNTLCIEPTTAPTTITNPTKKNLPLMAGVLSALVFLVLLGGAVIYTQEKMKRNKATEEADEQELTYAEVRIVQRQGLKVQQRAEVEVEYGQVKYSEQPRQTVVPTGDDCVYAKVHKSS